MSAPVVLVNENDRPLGTIGKLRAHTEGLLHRAFSVFIFDPQGRLLLQQRAADKYHSGGLWSNTCCSHPHPGESPLEGALRRLPEELGFCADLSPVLQETYHLPVGDNLTEYEHTHVFVGTAAAPEIDAAATEVADWRWRTPDALQRELQRYPERYTSWFRHLLPLVLTAPPGHSLSPPHRRQEEAG
jgi:isopentenyl-diphosphate delta-isomerase